MGERRNVLFLLAAVLVVIAVGLVLFYVNSADDRAKSNVEQVEALVAVQPIPEGTTGQTAVDRGWIRFEDRQRGTIPDNAIRDANTVKDLVAPATISKNQFITTDSFVPRSQAAPGGALVGQISQEGDPDPSGRQAVAISFDSEKALNGQVVPGDVVNIIAIGGAGEGGGTSAAFLLSKAPVIGSPTVGGEAAVAGGGSIILSLNPDEVLKLLAAKTSGATLWLTLVPRDYDTPLPGPVTMNGVPGGAPVF